jgi:hypothetical protein
MNVEFDIKKLLVDIKQGINKLKIKVYKTAENVSGIKTDLTRVKAEIKGNIHRLKADVKGDIRRLEAELKGSIGILDQKVDGLTKRVDTQDFIN